MRSSSTVPRSTALGGWGKPATYSSLQAAAGRRERLLSGGRAPTRPEEQPWTSAARAHHWRGCNVLHSSEPSAFSEQRPQALSRPSFHPGRVMPSQTRSTSDQDHVDSEEDTGGGLQGVGGRYDFELMRPAESMGQHPQGPGTEQVPLQAYMSAQGGTNLTNFGPRVQGHSSGYPRRRSSSAVGAIQRSSTSLQSGAEVESKVAAVAAAAAQAVLSVPASKGRPGNERGGPREQPQRPATSQGREMHPTSCACPSCARSALQRQVQEKVRGTFSRMRGQTLQAPSGVLTEGGGGDGASSDEVFLEDRGQSLKGPVGSYRAATGKETSITQNAADGVMLPEVAANRLEKQLQPRTRASEPQPPATGRSQSQEARGPMSWMEQFLQDSLHAPKPESPPHSYPETPVLLPEGGSASHASQAVGLKHGPARSHGSPMVPDLSHGSRPALPLGVHPGSAQRSSSVPGGLQGHHASPAAQGGKAHSPSPLLTGAQGPRGGIGTKGQGEPMPPGMAAAGLPMPETAPSPAASRLDRFLQDALTAEKPMQAGEQLMPEAIQQMQRKAANPGGTQSPPVMLPAFLWLPAIKTRDHLPQEMTGPPGGLDKPNSGHPGLPEALQGDPSNLIGLSRMDQFLQDSLLASKQNTTADEHSLPSLLEGLESGILKEEKNGKGTQALAPRGKQEGQGERRGAAPMARDGGEKELPEGKKHVKESEVTQQTVVEDAVRGQEQESKPAIADPRFRKTEAPQSCQTETKAATARGVQSYETESSSGKKRPSQKTTRLSELSALPSDGQTEKELLVHQEHAKQPPSKDAREGLANAPKFRQEDRDVTKEYIKPPQAYEGSSGSGPLSTVSRTASVGVGPREPAGLGLPHSEPVLEALDLDKGRRDTRDRKEKPTDRAAGFLGMPPEMLMPSKPRAVSNIKEKDAGDPKPEAGHTRNKDLTRGLQAGAGAANLASRRDINADRTPFTKEMKAKGVGLAQMGRTKSVGALERPPAEATGCKQTSFRTVSSAADVAAVPSERNSASSTVPLSRRAEYPQGMRLSRVGRTQSVGAPERPATAGAKHSEGLKASIKDTAAGKAEATSQAMSKVESRIGRTRSVGPSDCQASELSGTPSMAPSGTGTSSGTSSAALAGSPGDLLHGSAGSPCPAPSGRGPRAGMGLRRVGRTQSVGAGENRPTAAPAEHKAAAAHSTDPGKGQAPVQKGKDLGVLLSKVARTKSVGAHESVPKAARAVESSFLQSHEETKSGSSGTREHPPASVDPLQMKTEGAASARAEGRRRQGAPLARVARTQSVGAFEAPAGDIYTSMAKMTEMYYGGAQAEPQGHGAELGGSRVRPSTAAGSRGGEKAPKTNAALKKSQGAARPSTSHGHEKREGRLVALESISSANVRKKLASAPSGGKLGPEHLPSFREGRNLHASDRQTGGYQATSRLLEDSKSHVSPSQRESGHRGWGILQPFSGEGEAQAAHDGMELERERSTKEARGKEKKGFMSWLPSFRSKKGQSTGETLPGTDADTDGTISLAPSKSERNRGGDISAMVATQSMRDSNHSSTKVGPKELLPDSLKTCSPVPLERSSTAAPLTGKGEEEFVSSLSYKTGEHKGLVKGQRMRQGQELGPSASVNMEKAHALSGGREPFLSSSGHGRPPEKGTAAAGHFGESTGETGGKETNTYQDYQDYQDVTKIPTVQSTHEDEKSSKAGRVRGEREESKSSKGAQQTQLHRPSSQQQQLNQSQRRDIMEARARPTSKEWNEDSIPRNVSKWLPADPSNLSAGNKTRLPAEFLPKNSPSKREERDQLNQRRQTAGVPLVGLKAAPGASRAKSASGVSKSLGA